MKRNIHQISVGDCASMCKTITEAEVLGFADLTGDANPLHMDEAAAAEGPFGRRVAHGMLLGGLISAVIGTQLPGEGTVYLRQGLTFSAPVYLGDTVTATVTVKVCRAEFNICTLETQCVNQDGVVVLSGEATVMPPK